MYVDDLLNRAEQHAETGKSIINLPGLTPDVQSYFRSQFNTGHSPLTPGVRFTQSEGYKSIADPASRSTEWSSGPVQITDGPVLMKAGTLSETVGSGGGLIPVPQVMPGATLQLFQSVVVEQCLSAQQASGNSVRYIVEGTATSGAAAVAEGGLKPPSDLAYSTADESIKKIATFLTVSDELLEDAPNIQALINGRLLLFVQREVERELLRGTAGGSEIQGLLTSRGVPVYSGGTAAGNKAEQLFKAMNSMRGSAYLEPEWVIVSPADYEAIRLLKDDSGQLYGGGPFFGPYGNVTPVGASGQVTGVVDSLWSKPCYVTSALGAGTALIGTTQSATVWSRGGVSVEATNAHGSLFQLNLVAIRSERRVGLTVTRSAGFVEARLA